MNRRAIVKADHIKHQASLTFTDENENSPVDSNGNEYRDILFPYTHLKEYDILFESLGTALNGIEYFHFKLFSFDK
jgi:hypothetical protein